MEEDTCSFIWNNPSFGNNYSGKIYIKRLQALCILFWEDYLLERVSLEPFSTEESNIDSS